MLDSFRTAIDAKKDNDFRGEEGTLHRVVVDEQPLWAKRWYRSHDKRISMPFEIGGAALSPFWHKRQELQYRLINELFPNETPKMRGSYDERVGGSKKFNLGPGRPVTVENEVKGDPELWAVRDKVMRRAYDVLLKYRDGAMKTGGILSSDDAAIAGWRLNLDKQMNDLLGKDVTMGPVMKDVAEIAARAKMIAALNPESVILDMLVAGINPIHPETNFIPGNAQTHERKPYGTFLELRIFDLQKLADVLYRKYSRDPQKQKDIFDKLQAYMIVADFDLIFDQVLELYTKKTAMDFNEESMMAIYEALQQMKVMTERSMKDGLRMDVNGALSLMKQYILGARSHGEMADLLQGNFMTDLRNRFPRLF